MMKALSAPFAVGIFLLMCGMVLGLMLMERVGDYVEASALYKWSARHWTFL